MFLDSAVEKAKNECVRFTSCAYKSKAEEAAALDTVLAAVKMVLIAANLSTGMDKKDGTAIEIFKAHREVREIRQVVRVSLTQDGSLMKEDRITCPEECHVFGQQIYKVETLPLLESGVPSKKIIENLNIFLSDTAGAMTLLGQDRRALKN